jgi:formylmethanofuran dehydrogenase subunit E
VYVDSRMRDGVVIQSARPPECRREPIARLFNPLMIPSDEFVFTSSPEDDFMQGDFMSFVPSRARRQTAGRMRRRRGAGSMDLGEFIRCGTLAHGHPCPPLVLGVRAGLVAMTRLGVGRALDHELFAFVELGSDHYAQGFADGVQFVTGCTFGKDLIIRLPHGKVSMQLVDQERGRATRVTPRPETIAALEQSAWFRACASNGKFASECTSLAGPITGELLTASEDALFAVSPVFPLRIEYPHPTFESVVCEACGERVLSSYVREIGHHRLCVACEGRRRMGLVEPSASSQAVALDGPLRSKRPRARTARRRRSR